MKVPSQASGVIGACGLVLFAAFVASGAGSVDERTTHVTVRLVESRGLWRKLAPSTSITKALDESCGELGVRRGEMLQLDFESNDYIYLLSQPELGLEIVVIPRQPCSMTVQVAIPGRYEIVARGFCGNLWQHADPPLCIVCRQ